MKNPELCVSLGRAARKKAIQEYSIERSASDHEASYRRLVYNRMLPLSEEVEEVSVIENSIPQLPEKDSISPNTVLSNTTPQEGVVISNTSYVRCVSTNDAIEAAVADAQPLYEPQMATSWQRVNYSTNLRPIIPSVAEDNNCHHKQLKQATMPVKDSEERTEWQTSNSSGIDSLAFEIAKRDATPIDALEITALLESQGITDEVAEQRYGAPDTFELGAAILSLIKGLSLSDGTKERESKPDKKVGRRLADYARGPLTLYPVLVVLFIISAYSYLGKWDQRQVLILSAGMSASILVANGFIQAVNRRTAIYISHKRSRAAKRFFGRSTILVGTIMVLVSSLAVLVAKQLGIFSTNESLIFLLPFVGLTILWLTIGGLSLIQQTGWLAIGLTTGIIVSVIVYRTFTPFLKGALVLATGVGYIVTMILLITVVQRGFSNLKDVKSTEKKNQIHFPSYAYILHEAVPFFAYGSLYMVFILMPHLIAWIAAMKNGYSLVQAVNTVEMGLTLSLLPLILSGGFAEHALQLFWHHAPTSQKRTPADDIDQFNQSLKKFYRRHLLVYMIVLTLLSVAAYTLFHELLSVGRLSILLNLEIADQTKFIFDAGLVAYGLLGLGLFNFMFCITLDCIEPVIWAVVLGIAITVVVGVVLGDFNFSYSSVGFVCGAVTFFLASLKAVDHTLEQSDYHFASSF
jgi:uncharacterized membrane protein